MLCGAEFNQENAEEDWRVESRDLTSPAVPTRKQLATYYIGITQAVQAQDDDSHKRSVSSQLVNSLLILLLSW